jgi:hypothetical protein
MATKALWDKLRLAQDTKNGDAALAFKNAIDRSNKGKTAEAAWWEQQGDLATNFVPTREHVKV